MNSTFNSEFMRPTGQEDQCFNAWNYCDKFLLLQGEFQKLYMSNATDKQIEKKDNSFRSNLPLVESSCSFKKEHNFISKVRKGKKPHLCLPDGWDLSIAVVYSLTSSWSPTFHKLIFLSGQLPVLCSFQFFWVFLMCLYLT